MSDNIIEYNFGQRPPPPPDAIVTDSLELLRIFTRVDDSAVRRAIIRMLDYMLMDDNDASKCDGVYPP
jgi:hypothetical protein